MLSQLRKKVNTPHLWRNNLPIPYDRIAMNNKNNTKFLPLMSILFSMMKYSIATVNPAPNALPYSLIKDFLFLPQHKYRRNSTSTNSTLEVESCFIRINHPNISLPTPKAVALIIVPPRAALGPKIDPIVALFLLK